MDDADKLAEHQEMAGVQEGNHNLVVDDIDWCVDQVGCVCQWQFVNYYLMILKRCPSVVAGQIGHPVETHLQMSVEITSLTCSVMQDGGKLP